MRDGPKRATTSVLEEYERDAEPLPIRGEYSVILDGNEDAVRIIRTTSVEVRRFGAVDGQFAFGEGEGDRSLAYWRDAHIRAFSRKNRPIDEETPVVLERFELV